jgi:hypothetical protein
MRFVSWIISVWLIAVVAQKPEGAVYRFEPEPRAVLLAAGAQSSRDPKLALRASGALYMLAVYGEQGAAQLGLFVSHDGGDSFEPPIAISEKGARISSHGENSPSLAFGSTEVYALWEQAGPEGGSDLMFARSLMFGRKFEKPIRVTDKATPSTNSFSSMAVAPNGHIYAVWLDGRDANLNPRGTSSVYIARSTDRGASFSKNIRVAGGACPCCRPQIAFGSKGEVFVAWRKVFEGDIRDIVVSTSLDGGESFAEPRRVAVDNWRISGCPHSGPAVAVMGRRLYISWFSEGSGADAGIRLSWSDDGARTFAKPVIVSGKTLDSNHPALSVSEDGKVLLVFAGRDPIDKSGWGRVRPYLVEVSKTGMPSEPMAIPSGGRSAAYPAVVAGTLGRAFIAWTEVTERGPQVMLSRARRRSAAWVD